MPMSGSRWLEGHGRHELLRFSSRPLRSGSREMLGVVGGVEPVAVLIPCIPRWNVILGRKGGFRTVRGGRLDRNRVAVRSTDLARCPESDQTARTA